MPKLVESLGKSTRTESQNRPQSADVHFESATHRAPGQEALLQAQGSNHSRDREIPEEEAAGRRRGRAGVPRSPTCGP